MILPKLFTPGPLETRAEVKKAMLRDIGSRDTDLIDITRRIRRRILALANASREYTCIPLQGSGTFGMEAAIETFIDDDAKCLVLVNGLYGERIAKILAKANIRKKVLTFASNDILDVARIEQEISADRQITHALFVYCETTTGVVNPMNELVTLFRRHNVTTVIDAVSAFGALPLNAEETPFDVLVTSSNKCIESVPGVSLTLARTDLLHACRNNASSFCLDLYQQWLLLEQSGQWRFTPPTHVLQALDIAIDHLIKETVEGRYARYVRNKNIVIEGLRELGLEPCVNEKHQSPICLAFPIEKLGHKFDFNEFYQKLREKGVLVYHAMDESTKSFRIGCIGYLSTSDFVFLTGAIRQVIEELSSKDMDWLTAKEIA